MNYKCVKIGIVLFFALGHTGLYAQTMNVHERSGTQIFIDLSSINKLTFSKGKLNLNKTDGNTQSFDLTNVQYLNYTDFTTDIPIDDIQETEHLAIFPNPANDVINVLYPLSTGDKLQVEIVSITGKVVYQKIYKTQQNKSYIISISTLPKGIYICRAYDENTIFTTKFLKN